MIRGAVVVPGPADPRLTTGRARVRGPIAFGVVLSLLIGGGATAWYCSSPSSPVSEAPLADVRIPASSAAPFEVVELRVGDCFDADQPATEAESGLARRPCSDEHRYEVFWTATMPAGSYPSMMEFDAFYDDHCEAAFASYVGESWGASGLDIFWMVPNEDGWNAGVRDVQCSVYDPVHPRLTDSLKGARLGGDSIPL